MFDPSKKEFYLKYIKENFGKISQREMARSLDIGKTTVNHLCKHYLGLKVAKPSANDRFFRKWTPEMGYTLGYIAADGNICWNSNPKKAYHSLTITAAEKDKSHLERIRAILNSSKELLYSPKTKSYRLIVANKTVCLDLMKLGIKPRKSLTIKFPKVPKKFLRDFIRGVIDGDGSVRYLDRERSPYFEVQIYSGSEKFIKELKRKIYSILKINSPIKELHKNTYGLRYTCQRGIQLANWIYYQRNFYLERKFQQFKLALFKNKNYENIPNIRICNSGARRQNL